MRKLTAMSLSALVLGGIALLAQAQDEVPKQPKQTDRSQAVGDGGLFDRLDQNKDGVIAEDEISEERKRFFARLLRAGDKDDDGKLTREEFNATSRAGRGRGDRGNRDDGNREERGREATPFGGQFFRSLDKNDDGKVVLDEIPEQRRDRMKAFISRLDKDGDGVLTREEFEAAARDHQRIPMGPPMGPPNPANSPFFRAIDRDRDGKLSSDELTAAGEALKTLDKNGDGSITVEELMPPPRDAARPGDQRDAQRLARAYMDRIMQADADGDGKLSKDEAPERMKENFARLDTNSDDLLDQAEIRQMFERFRGRDASSDHPRQRERQNKDADKEKKATDKETKKAEEKADR